MTDRRKEERPASVSDGTKQVGEMWDRWSWVEPDVWTERMLTALEEGVAGQMLTLLNVGCSPWSQPMQKSVNPLGGEPPTGEPCAGEPHARFGGGRDQVTGSSYPYQRKID